MSFYRPGPPTFFAKIPEGTEGIKTTMRLMSAMVKAWKRDPGIVALAGDLTQHLAQNDYPGEVIELHAFVRDRIRYIGDTAEVETLRTPRRVLEDARGDCDDKSTLLATLLESINHKTRFKAGAFQAQGVYTHVWVQTALGGSWYDLETTKPVPAGWGPPGIIEPSLYAHN